VAHLPPARPDRADLRRPDRDRYRHPAGHRPAQCSCQPLGLGTATITPTIPPAPLHLPALRNAALGRAEGRRRTERRRPGTWSQVPGRCCLGRPAGVQGDRSARWSRWRPPLTAGYDEGPVVHDHEAFLELCPRSDTRRTHTYQDLDTAAHTSRSRPRATGSRTSPATQPSGRRRIRRSVTASTRARL
jgi:hypothetical protein